MICFESWGSADLHFQHRWDPCIAHYDEEFDDLIESHFLRDGRTILLIAGAGFDPRSCEVTERLARGALNVRAFFLRETRPNADPVHLDRADRHTATLLRKLPSSSVETVQIFGPDNAVVGGRHVVNAIRLLPLEGITDVVVDVSALSVGLSFPIVRYFVQRIPRLGGSVNLHLVVVHDPFLDSRIFARPGDHVGYIHGFKGPSMLSDYDRAARLWLPQLAPGMRDTLDQIRAFVEPHDTCPILPFPALDPRLGDTLSGEYLTELETDWEVDARNIVYADERDPLDLYRTILKLDESRKSVFSETGGSILILSPLGSKLMALGALMAALERDLPVAYLEPIGFHVKGDEYCLSGELRIVHVWLEGNVYPHDQRRQYRGGVATGRTE